MFWDFMVILLKFLYNDFLLVVTVDETMKTKMVTLEASVLCSFHRHTKYRTIHGAIPSEINPIIIWENPITWATEKMATYIR